MTSPHHARDEKNDRSVTMETEAETPATNSEYQLTASTSLCYKNWLLGQLTELAQVIK